MFDYRNLLVRYIAHLGSEEGYTYLPIFGSRFAFTAEELSELQKIEDESSALSIHTPADAWHEPISATIRNESTASSEDSLPSTLSKPR